MKYTFWNKTRFSFVWIYFKSCFQVWYLKVLWTRFFFLYCFNPQTLTTVIFFAKQPTKCFLKLCVLYLLFVMIWIAVLTRLMVDIIAVVSKHYITENFKKLIYITVKSPIKEIPIRCVCSIIHNSGGCVINNVLCCLVRWVISSVTVLSSIIYGDNVCKILDDIFESWLDGY